jgi:hypothetical protein
LAPGDSATFVLTATVNSTTSVGIVLTNTASVRPTTDDSNPANNTLTLTTTTGEMTQSVTTQVDLSSSFNQIGIVADGTPSSVGLDGNGDAYSTNLLGSTVTANGVDFNLGAAFTVNYTDGTSDTFTQGMSDWLTPQGYAGESNVLVLAIDLLV